MIEDFILPIIIKYFILPFIFAYILYKFLIWVTPRSLQNVYEVKK